MAPKPGAPQATVPGTAQVLISLDAENEAKGLLQRLPSHHLATTVQPTALQHNKLQQQYAKVYDALVGYGFSLSSIEQCLRTLPLGAATETACLDWLCLHLPDSELPRKFSSGVRVLQAAEVKLINQNTGAVRAHQPEEGEDGEEEVQEEAGGAAGGTWDSSDEEEEEGEEEEADQSESGNDQEKGDDKDWLKRYILQAAGGSETEEGEESEAESSDSMEMWEAQMWADPREVERRRQERARSKIPPEQRRQQVAEEFVRARQLAAQAKSSGNKAQQKETGELIRSLKQEMQALGLTEDQAAALADKSSSQSKAAEESTGANGADGFSLWDEEPTPAPAPAETVSKGGAAAAGAGAQQAGQEDWEMPMDLFGEGDSETLSNIPTVATKTKPATAQEPLTPWGADQENQAASRAGPPPPPGARQAGSSTDSRQQPKAHLSQLCQRSGWGQPRYERVKDTGGSQGLQYTCSVDFGVARGAAKSKGLHGVKTYSVPPSPEYTCTWTTVAEAQNAAATRALYEVLASEKPFYHQLLGGPWQDLWKAWHSEAEQAGTSAQENLQQKKVTLIDEVIASKLATAGQQAVQQERQRKQTGHVREHKGAQAIDWEQAELGMAAGGASEDDEDEQAEEEQKEPDTSVGTAREQQVSQQLLESLRRWQNSAEGHKMGAARAKLPIVTIREGLRSALAQGDVVCVQGDTGSGKTTQVPQFILEEETLRGAGGRCHIVVTQPRRVAAVSVAERVATERGEPAPGSHTPSSTVGYHVRLDSARTPHTRLLFVTTGILLRQLAHDPLLSTLSHVVVDEVHERTLDADFLMAVLKDVVVKRRAAGAPLKLILMSATVNAEQFAQYYDSCPVLRAEGRTFPVQHLFLEDVYSMTGYVLAPDAPAALRDTGAASAAALRKQAGSGNKGAQKLLAQGWGDEAESVLNPDYDSSMYEDYSANVRKNLARLNESVLDYDLVEALISHVDSNTQQQGAILVFLPGMGEIRRVHAALTSTRQFARHWVLPLHSSVSPQEQRKVFEIPRPPIRKIILATNIAETSLTIPDVTVVIDSGLMREKRYDPKRRIATLDIHWESRANALQRKGRAGRVQEGQCYSLYTRHRFENVLRAYQQPEIQRVPLEQMVLQVHVLGLGPAGGFLQRTLDPPSSQAVSAAIRTLKEVGAITTPQSTDESEPSDQSSLSEVLTPLGRYMAMLPLDPRLGKLLVYATFFGTLAPALTVAAAMSLRSPFLTPFDQQEEAARARRLLCDSGAATVAAGQQSDHLCLVAAYDLWQSTLATKGPKAAAALCSTHFLHQQTLQELKELRGQLAGMLADAALVSPDGAPGGQGPNSSRVAWYDTPQLPANKYSTRPEVVKAVLASALLPNIICLSEASTANSEPLFLVNFSSPVEGGGGQTSSSRTEQCRLHPSCVAAKATTRQLLSPYFIYLEQVSTNRALQARDVTPISPLALIFFGQQLKTLHAEGAVLVNRWLRVRVAAQTAVVLVRLKEALDDLLQQKVRHPHQELSPEEARVIPTIIRLLTDAEAQTAH